MTVPLVLRNKTFQRQVLWEIFSVQQSHIFEYALSLNIVFDRKSCVAVRQTQIKYLMIINLQCLYKKYFLFLNMRVIVDHHTY
jgi:hypothetical protein